MGLSDGSGGVSRACWVCHFIVLWHVKSSFSFVRLVAAGVFAFITSGLLMCAAWSCGMRGVVVVCQACVRVFHL